MPTVALLEEDPDLGVGLTPEEHEAATQAIVTPLLSVPAGPWDTTALRAVSESLLGTLVLDGRMQRTMTVGDRKALHLFGPGDLLRPWDDDDLGLQARGSCAWEAMEPSRVALLDRRFIVTASRWPAVLIELSRRHAGQSARIQLQAAFVQMTRVDDRVLLHFWRLGQRWGRMTPDGILVPIQLTHARIAELVGARRPPVSTALGRLAREGLLQRVDEGWLVSREVEGAVARAIGQEPEPAAGPASPPTA